MQISVGCKGRHWADVLCCNLRNRIVQVIMTVTWVCKLFSKSIRFMLQSATSPWSGIVIRFVGFSLTFKIVLTDVRKLCLSKSKIPFWNFLPRISLGIAARRDNYYENVEQVVDKLTLWYFRGTLGGSFMYGGVPFLVVSVHLAMHSYSLDKWGLHYNNVW